MNQFSGRSHFASAPVSWGVQDDRGPAWKQGYGQILEEILHRPNRDRAGPRRLFSDRSAVLNKRFERTGLSLLSSFVPVPITDPVNRQR